MNKKTWWQTVRFTSRELILIIAVVLTGATYYYELEVNLNTAIANHNVRFTKLEKESAVKERSIARLEKAITDLIKERREDWRELRQHLRK